MTCHIWETFQRCQTVLQSLGLKMCKLGVMNHEKLNLCQIMKNYIAGLEILLVPTSSGLITVISPRISFLQLPVFLTFSLGLNLVALVTSCMVRCGCPSVTSLLEPWGIMKKVKSTRLWDVDTVSVLQMCIIIYLHGMQFPLVSFLSLCILIPPENHLLTQTNRSW